MDILLGMRGGRSLKFLDRKGAEGNGRSLEIHLCLQKWCKAVDIPILEGYKALWTAMSCLGGPAWFMWN